MIGRQIGHYEIIEKLGEGGMGMVFKARDTRLDRFVALKVLPPEKLAAPDQKRRFAREAKAASSLNHPNIITIHDIGEEGGVDYIVMEFVSGKTLDQIIPMNGMPHDKALKYAIQIADALATAHNAGIIHRDLKPSNIMVDEDDRVKVLDFGVAKLLDRPQDDSETIAGTLLETEQGAIVGTVAYMSPEQALGRKLDGRSDIFSMGLILYQMLTARHAFEGSTKISILAAILHADPLPIRQLIDDLRPDLEKVIQACLYKDPGQRFQQAGELCQALKNLLAGRTAERAAATRITPSIAVLPFENFSPDKENEYFSDGLAEEIINALAKVPGFRVVGHTSSFTFRGRKFGIHEIGEKLHVETLLEGSVRKAGKRLRISAQLVNVSDGYQIWSERYDRKLNDIFEIQDEISNAIVAALKSQFAGGDEKPEAAGEDKKPAVRGVNIEAHEAYLRGRYFWNQRSWSSLKKGIDNFNQAISKDPLQAQAYVGLADSYNLFGYYNERLPRETYPNAKAAALQALRIDGKLAEAHASLGYTILFFDWDWAESEKAFKRAIELNPAYASAHQWYGWFYFATGRLEEAIETMRRAHSIDPLAPIINNHLGLALATAGRDDQAIDQLEKSIEMSPAFALHYLVLGSVYLKQKKHDAGIQNFLKAVEVSPDKQLLGWLGHAYATSGKENEAREVLVRLHHLAQQQCVSPLSFALIHAGLNENDLAFEWLEHAYEERTSDLIRFKLYPWPDPIRQDSRFLDLAKRIGLEV